MNYYNDIDLKACEWLRQLIAQELIPNGVVDSRSIKEIKPDELRQYTQCHFFAGIAGWPVALQLAGWPESEPVWTGSCPCQPFSCAGSGKGTADERHLWPAFAKLIQSCKPPVVFGEQVASKAGREWLAGVFADLEGMGYQRAGADLCAAGVGAPHIRQRLYWVADANGARRTWSGQAQSEKRNGDFVAAGTIEACRMGDASSSRRIGTQSKSEGETWHETRLCVPSESGTACRLADASSKQANQEQQRPQEAEREWSADCAGRRSVAGWGNSTIIAMRDGKSRRIESGSFPLVDGFSGRVGLLRGYGNAIVPQIASEFISAWIECCNKDV